VIRPERLRRLIVAPHIREVRAQPFPVIAEPTKPPRHRNSPKVHRPDTSTDPSAASFPFSLIPSRTVFQDQQQPAPLFVRPPATSSCTRVDSPPRVGPRRVCPDHALSRTCAPHVRARRRASATTGDSSPTSPPACRDDPPRYRRITTDGLLSTGPRRSRPVAAGSPSRAASSA
jgi:hypothetical protein